MYGVGISRLSQLSQVVSAVDPDDSVDITYLSLSLVCSFIEENDMLRISTKSPLKSFALELHWEAHWQISQCISIASHSASCLEELELLCTDVPWPEGHSAPTGLARIWQMFSRVHHHFSLHESYQGQFSGKFFAPQFFVCIIWDCK